MDIYLSLRVAGFYIKLFRKATADTDPDKSLAQLGSVVPLLIQEIIDTDDNIIPILFRKLEINDGFWQLVF